MSRTLKALVGILCVWMFYIAFTGDFFGAPLPSGNRFFAGMTASLWISMFALAYLGLPKNNKNS